MPPNADPPKKSAKDYMEKSRVWVQRKASECCSMETLKRILPVINWLPKYRKANFTSDMVAGITVGLTAIPQSMGYAQVANLPFQYGLYSSFMGCFVYFFFGSTIPANIGPTAIMALLTRPYVEKNGVDSAILLCFLAGFITFCFGVLNLGFLIDFVSSPVISGFSSAAAIIIASTQLKGLLGITIEDENVIGVITAVYEQFRNIKYWDLSLGMVCLIVLLLLRKLGSVQWQDEASPSTLKIVLRKLVWFLCAGRNVVVVIVASVIVYILECNKANPFSLTGEVPPGLPPFQLPPFELRMPGNQTLSFTDCLKEFNSSLILVPLLAILEHIAISKVFTRGKSLDATQELIALGLSNVMGSFVSSFPSTGSFSRTALNANCGVKSPLGGVFTGIVVLLALAFLTPSFHMIPKATLSAVIITAVMFMVEYRMLPHLWKTKKIDLAVMVVTFFACLFLGVEWGIVIGIGFSMLGLLYNTARPRISINLITLSNKKYIFLQPDRMLNFPSAEYLRHRVTKATKGNGTLPIILDGVYLCGIDYTVIQCVKGLIDEFQEKNQILIFINLKMKVVEKIKVLEKSNFHYYSSLEELEASLNNQSSAMVPELTTDIHPVSNATNSPNNEMSIPLSNGNVVGNGFPPTAIPSSCVLSIDNGSHANSTDTDDNIGEELPDGGKNDESQQSRL